MGIKNLHYFLLILIHIFLGIAVFYCPPIAKMYGFFILIFGVYFIVANKNKNHEVLYASAYLVGAEVFLRATNGGPNYEFGKYCILLFMILGIYYSGIPKKINLFWIFILLLIPSIIFTLYLTEFELTNKILFSVSGPICLGVCSLYTFRKNISSEEINTILLAIGMPSVTTCFYLLIQSPPIIQSIRSIESNYLLSGNFGPNQMATSLGLGMFVFFLRLVLIPTNKFINVLNCILIGLLFHRALLTFSRGGIITGVLIIVILLISTSLNSSYKSKIITRTVLFIVLFSSVFAITSCKTNEYLMKRYDNQKLLNILTPKGNDGRPDLALTEIKMFIENPILGVGAGLASEKRKLEFKTQGLTHNEFTRVMAEQGFLGIISIFILIIIPIQIYFGNKNNVYFFSFYAFWFLTINHSAMRIAAPSFVYALTLLHINTRKKSQSVQAGCN